MHHVFKQKKQHLNNRDFNIDQNNRDHDDDRFFSNRAALPPLPSPPSAIQPPAQGLHLPGPVRDQPACQGPGVLLRQHPLHEGLPEDRGPPV